jgi:hypothetical protein
MEYFLVLSIFHCRIATSEFVLRIISIINKARTIVILMIEFIYHYQIDVLFMDKYKTLTLKTVY